MITWELYLSHIHDIFTYVCVCVYIYKHIKLNQFAIHLKLNTTL